MAFDPHMFGIKEIKVMNGGERVHGCYLRITSSATKSNPTYKSLELVMDKDASDLVVESFGGRVDAGVDNKGRIFLWKASGRGRKVSGRSKNDCKKIVNLSSETKSYMELMGRFRRLYMDYDFYAGGEAIVFTPTGEKDMV